MHYLDYNESKQHGTIDFPVEYYYVDEQHPRYVMPYHWHKEYELIRILEGRFTISLGGITYDAAAGDMIFVSEGLIHGGTPHNCLYECIVFDLKSLFMHGSAMKQYMTQITRHTITVQSHFTRADASLCEVANRLFLSMNQKASAYELNSAGALYSFFGILFQKELYTINSEADKRSLKKATQLKAVLEYIENHFSEEITLEAMSRMAGMSPKYFCRYFKTFLHKTPIEYLNHKRIEQACYELNVLDHSVTEVGYNCGFHDTSYFIRIFKKYTGITPKQMKMHLTTQESKPF